MAKGIRHFSMKLAIPVQRWGIGGMEVYPMAGKILKIPHFTILAKLTPPSSTKRPRNFLRLKERSIEFHLPSTPASDHCCNFKIFQTWRPGEPMELQLGEPQPMEPQARKL